MPEKRIVVKSRSRTKTRSAAPVKTRKPVRTKPASKPSEPPPDPMHDGSRKPDDILLRKMLGKTMGLWEDLRSRLAEAFPSVREEWKFYGRKYGWSMKMLLGKRNLFFFAPQNGWFQIGFVFGEKGVGAVEKSGIPDRMKKELRESKKYMEGRGLRVDVRSPEDVEAVVTLADIKNRN